MSLISKAKTFVPTRKYWLTLDDELCCKCGHKQQTLDH